MEIVFALGAGHSLVGVTHECDYSVDLRAAKAANSSVVSTAALVASSKSAERASLPRQVAQCLLDRGLPSSLAEIPDCDRIGEHV